MDAAPAADCRRQGLRVGRRIGAGGFSTVYAAIDELTNEHVAVKLTRPPNRPSVLSVHNEIVALEELGDLPHVVSMRRHFACRSTAEPRHIVVMDLVRGSELFSIVQQRSRLLEPQARKIIHQVLESVAAMHRRGWVHRDLKLENVITDPRTNDSKIIDFGFAVRQTEAGPNCRGVIGTAQYVAPEVIWDAHYDGRAVDMFAVGVMMYVMLYGSYPFKRGNFGVAEHMRSADKRAFSATYRFPHRPTVSEEAKSFMRSLLASAPADRPTAEQALRDQTWVRHPDYEPTCDFPCEPQEVEEEEAEPPLPLPHTVSEIGTPMTPRQSSAREPSGSGSPMAAWARSNVDWARSKTTDVFGRLLFHS